MTASQGARETTDSKGLRVTVHNEVDGQTADLFFDQSPIRIGRNNLNDLVLNHPYVSQWHALVGRSGTAITITQVSTTNSVRVGQHRLSPNEEVTLQADEPIAILPFGLRVQLVDLPPGLRTAAQPPRDSVMAAAVSAGHGPQALQGVALQLLQRMSQRLVGQTFEDPRELATFGANLEKTLDVFVRCVLALRKSQVEFRQTLDLRALEPNSDDPVQTASSEQALAKALLDGGDVANAALEGMFKDIMIHQVALLNGLMAGVRSLLNKLSPKAVRKQVSKKQRSPGWRSLWDAFEQMHRDLAEEDNAAFDVIFGKQFGKAYTSVARKKP